MKSLVFLGVLLAGAALAQPPANSAAYPIRSMEVEGNQLYTDEQILAVSGLEIGMPADQAVFEQAQRTLLRSGAFETVGFSYGPHPEGGGYALVFQVAEIRQVYPIDFIHIDAPEDELRAWLRDAEPMFGDLVPGTEEMLARYSRHIEEYLDSAGRPEKIEGEVTMDRPGETYLLFHPAGPLPVVAEVDFTGSELIPAGELRRVINNVAVGTRYTEDRVRLLLDSSIRPLYEAQGRLRVTFPDIRAEQSPSDVQGLNVTVTVSEGGVFNFGSVRVEGTQSMNQRLEEIAALNSGSLANFDIVRAAVVRINRDMHEHGYMGVSTEVERNIHDDRGTVDLVLRVDPGPEYTFGRLFIKGLDINGEAEIERIWGLEQGAAFRSSYPDYFLEQVQEQGVFDYLSDTRSEIEVNDAAHTVDVTLIFNPEPEGPLPSSYDDPLSGN